MESMLNKLKSTVSSAASNAVSNAVSIASQVSNYLPGNPVTREYEATCHIASAGRGLMWKIYKGFKRSTKEEAAIFLFEKRQLDKWDRQERELMLDKIRKGVSQLTRLRHPQILTVQHPLEESRETLAFATEPVLASLANVLGRHDNMPTPVPYHLKDFTFYDVEIKYGLLQISEGLNFLHNSVKIVHRCISPETIVLNQQGAWKLFGFDFCVASHSPPDQPPMWNFEDYESSYHELSQPDLDYLGPEYALSHTMDPATDMFSFGILIYALYNKGRPVFQNHRDFAIFKRNASEFKNPNKLSLEDIPSGLKEQVRLMLNSTPQLRPDALQFSKISFFDDIGVKTLNYLDQIFQWDNMQKSQFYKSLPQIIPHLPQRVLLLRVIPCLNKECINPTMVPFVLPVMLQVAESATKEDYIQYILPLLKPIMKIIEPMQVMLLLMLKMELLLSKTPAHDIRTDALPLLYRALECNTQQIQELCLNVLPTCAPLVDNPTMKNALLPRIKKLCLSTGYLSVRVSCLVCIGKVIEYLDKWLVIDEVFPFLETVPSKEAPVIMAMVGIYKVALYHKKLGISKEILATKVLPYLFPLSIENSLSPAQHDTLMILIKDMIERVETEHKTKLEHLNSIRREQKSLELTMPSSIPGSQTDTSKNDKGYVSPEMSSILESTSTKKMSKSVSNGLSKGLSLEEKKRLADQQNVQKNFSKQTPLLPSPPPPSQPIKNRSVESNSYSDFVASNISNLNLSNKTDSKFTPQTSMNFNSVGGVGNVNWGSQSLSAAPTSSFTPRTSNSFNNNIPMGFPSQPPAMGLSHSMSLPYQMSNNMNTFNAPVRYGNMPLLQPSMTSANLTMANQNKDFKPLSSDDINDLLS
ncbi:UNVERIFIED_CONTAM: hypothetical protein RMT77_017884 [Armadillidium vulgare]